MKQKKVYIASYSGNEGITTNALIVTVNNVIDF